LQNKKAEFAAKQKIADEAEAKSKEKHLEKEKRSQVKLKQQKNNY
jgi:hypothetical protein